MTIVGKVLASATMLLMATSGLSANEDVAAFYKGKTIRLIVGAAAGGGYDAYARLIARFMPKYIPGDPTIVPSNMPGGGGNIAAAFLYNLAPKDGTTFAAVLPGTITEQLLQSRESPKHDPAKLIYVGSANSEVNMCYVRADTGVKSLRDLQTQEVVIGASTEGGSTRDQPTVQKNLLGSKFKIVTGYPGTREIFLAIEKNEVSGICGIGLPSFMTIRPTWIQDGFMRIISQDNARGDPKITAAGVPLTVEFAKTPQDRKVMELIYSQQNFGRPYILPPGVPDDRVAALREAFIRALQDKELLAAAKTMKLDISPVSGTDLQKQIEEVYSTPTEIVERARKALTAQ
jgi:tripartite-type tricarboxylate transporter receptor subunit TctC